MNGRSHADHPPHRVRRRRVPTSHVLQLLRWRIWLYLPFIALLAFAIGGVYLYDQIGEAIWPLAIAALAGLAILYVKTR